MPDFVAPLFLTSQGGDGVSPHLLERHEVESYLLEPALFEAASKLIGRTITQAQARAAILKAAKGIKAKARRTSLETAKNVNRHLLPQERWKDAELEEKVYEWFDGLNLESIDVIQRVFPGKETLEETLKNLSDGTSKQLTRGHLVASISPDCVASDIRDLLFKVGEANPNKLPQATSRPKRSRSKRKGVKAAHG
jgi:hypothetical protein